MKTSSCKLQYFLKEKYLLEQGKMAKMFKHSEDANVQELTIFTTPPTNTSVCNPQYNEHHPLV